MARSPSRCASRRCLAAVFRWTRFGHATDAAAENPVRGSGARVLARSDRHRQLGPRRERSPPPPASSSRRSCSSASPRSRSPCCAGWRRRSSGRSARSGGRSPVRSAIGVVESTLSRYIENKGIFGPVVSDDGLLLGKFTSASVYRSSAFLLIVVVMVVGGRSLPLRSALLDRLPAVGTGRVSRIGIAVALARHDRGAAARSRRLDAAARDQHGDRDRLSVARRRHRVRRTTVARPDGPRRLRGVGGRSPRHVVRLAVPPRRHRRRAHRDSRRSARRAARLADPGRQSGRAHVRLLGPDQRDGARQLGPDRRVRRHPPVAADAVRRRDRCLAPSGPLRPGRACRVSRS